MHHKGRNRHHFEYWTDYDPVTRRVTPVKMPLGSVAELLCDRIAASKTYKGKEYTDRVLKDLYEMEKRGFDRISKKSDQILEDLNSLYQELENEKEND